MKEETVGHLQTLLGNENFEGLEIIVGTLGEQAPIIGRMLTSFKVRRLSKRLAFHERKIAELSRKIVTIDDSKFVDLLKNFLFPSILQQLLDEDEDNKTGYFLEGFKKTIDQRLLDESKLLIFFDTLKGLRFVEIEHLISLSNEYKESQQQKRSQSSVQFEDGIIYAIESKLEHKGLIKTPNSLNIQNKEDGPAIIYYNESELTVFGREFLDFYDLLEEYKVVI